MGRRWGKTVMGGAIVANVLRQHGKAAWIVPSYKNGRPLWRWMRSTFAGLAQSGKVDISKADQVITTHRGGFFAIYSEENIDSARGEWFHVIVNDEAAKFREESRYDVIEPLVADCDGDIIDISTPRGRNWFWREAMKADGHEQVFFHAPTSSNPSPAIRKAATMAKERMPERSYRQEWLAEFVDDGGGVFRHVAELATLQPATPYQGQFVLGVDWGKSNDFTVLTMIDVASNHMVAMERFNQIDYVIQMGRLKALYEQWKPDVIVAERNSIGEPLLEQLYRDGLPVMAFTTTNATKAAVIDGLAMALERRQITLINDPVLVSQLQAYEMERLPSGMMRYSAPDSMHDDCVMSLALAWHGASNQPAMEFA